MLLQDSLGGSAKALMIANLAPSPAHATETLSSLAFASKVPLQGPGLRIFKHLYRKHDIFTAPAHGDIIFRCPISCQSACIAVLGLTVC